MNIFENVSLKPYNTFGIDVTAERLLIANSTTDIEAASEMHGGIGHVLGGGSNILLCSAVMGLTVANRLKGISIVKQTDDHVWLQAAAGEQWHTMVMHAVKNGWGGIENLALIPGTVGAAPIQNIGAYGSEVKDVIEEVTYFNHKEKYWATLESSACKFGYRDSIFKNDLKGTAIVSSITLKLTRNPVVNMSYGALSHELEKMQIVSPGIADVAQAVINVRRSKLPDPAVIGNAGSFFKNPVISLDHFTTLRQQYQNIPSYPAGELQVKVPAGWLIEQCGWKGVISGHTGVHKLQALVLVNYGTATGDEIWQLSEEIVQSVKEKFAIELEREVQVWRDPH